MASPKLKNTIEQKNAVKLEEAEVGVLRQLSRLIAELTRSSSECRRIQRGSPGAGALTQSTQRTKQELNTLKNNVNTLLEKYSHFPGVAALRCCLTEFDSVLNEVVNEAGYDDGYAARVRYLERINYHSGILKGHVDAFLECVECLWSGPQERGGRRQTGVVRRLTFTDENSGESRCAATVQQGGGGVSSSGDIAGEQEEVLAI